MKVSLQWLKDYIAIDLPVDKLVHRLTMAGHEVKQQERCDGDTVFEIEITPNRPDCLNMLGLARELSAILNRPLRLPKIRKFKIPDSACPVIIENPKDCGRYVGAVIENVSVQPSPDDVKKRIQAIGSRTINSVVDITNFCLMENGQPLHAFDYDKLIGGKIIVRRARAGERIVTLDGVERTLNPSILIIADAARPVAIAGIMGGKDTEVTENTKRILLESAWFDPILIRRAGRSLGLSSDSSYRFERGVDIEHVGDGSHRAISLLLDISGGQLRAYTDIFPKKKKGAAGKVRITLEEIKKNLGIESLTIGKTKTILQKLGFSVSANKKGLLLSPPSFRADIREGVDIIEEVARIIGYDNVPVSLPNINITHLLPDAKYALKKTLRQTLQTLGLSEIITYPLLGQDSLEKTMLDTLPRVRVSNPLTLDQEFMRPSLLPDFLSVALTNVNRGQKDFWLFELGKIYFKENEKDVLAVMLAGAQRKDWRLAQKQAADFYDIKGVLDQTIMAFGGAAPEYRPGEDPVFSKGQSAALMIQDHKIGVLGKVDKLILKRWDIKHEDIYFAQIDLSELFARQHQTKRYEPLKEYPLITRDVSVAVKKEVAFREIVDLAREIGGELLVDIVFFEQYLGEKIPPGQRGLVFSLVYQSATRTLTEGEIAPLHDQICKAFVEKLGAVIR